MHHHRRPGLREPPRNALPDPTRGPGDEHHLPGEIGEVGVGPAMGVGWVGLAARTIRTGRTLRAAWAARAVWTAGAAWGIRVGLAGCDRFPAVTGSNRRPATVQAERGSPPCHGRLSAAIRAASRGNRAASSAPSPCS
ncbi:hypothetical protein HEK616_72790 [Streptomyces nigrescens]|uniref:Uncharacterized protein n=1 Tax=Streptomyces nigrescens TaxID=1920 RepID=A0ABM8A589_STRNI|nr:hypothetical protein HEK616_72790 [Streptomyces nigrescens]